MSIPPSEPGALKTRNLRARLASAGLVVEPTSTETNTELDGTISQARLVHLRCTRVRLSAFRGSWRPVADDRDTGRLLLHVAGASATRIDGVGARDDVGAARIARPGSRIDIVAPQPSERVLLEFPLTALPADAGAAMRRADPVPLGPTTISRALIAVVIALLDRPSRESSADAHHAERALVALIASVLVAAERTVVPTSEPTADTDVDALVFTRAVALVHNAFDRPEFDSAHVAAELGVSRRRLQRIVAENNTTVAELLRNRRLEVVAARLLAEPDADVGTIAQSVGFGVVDSVRRAFLNRYGMTMREYRAQHRVPR